MVSFYDYRTYTEFLHNISVQHATYEIIVHNIWFHFNTKHGHMLFILLYMCCATFIYKLSVGTTYSSYHTHPVKATFLSHNSCEHINRSHGTRDCDWVDNPLRRIMLHPHTRNGCSSQFIQRVSDICVLTIKLLPWHFLEVRNEQCGFFVLFEAATQLARQIHQRFCQQLERETGQSKFTFPHSLFVCGEATRF